MDWINAVIQGILLGGIYALFAAGLSLIFGVMRLVNIAHGDLIILAAYLGLSISSTLNLHPLLALLMVVPAMALVGYGLQRGILNQTLGNDILPPLLVTFGLSVIIQNALLEFYTADPQKLDAGAIETASLPIGGLNLGVLPVVIFLTAVAVVAPSPPSAATTSPHDTPRLPARKASSTAATLARVSAHRTMIAIFRAGMASRWGCATSAQPPVSPESAVVARGRV